MLLFKMNIEELVNNMLRRSEETKPSSTVRPTSGFVGYEPRNCPECSSLDYYETRSLESIRCCKCIFDWKSVTRTFTQWARDKGLPVDDGVTYEKILHQLSEAPISIVLDALYSGTYVQSVRKTVAEVVKSHVFVNGKDRFSPWEFLDVGTGNGILASDIGVELDVMPSVLDVTDRMLTRIPKGDFFARDTFNEGGIIPHQSESFAFVTCFQYLHHTPDPGFLVREIHRVMSSGGILLIQEFDCCSWAQAFSLDYYHQAVSAALGEDASVDSHRSRAGWRKIVTDAGFELIQEEQRPVEGPYRLYFDVFRKP